MQPSTFDLDVKSILDYIRIASETIGATWLQRKLKEHKKRQSQDKLSATKRKYTFLYRPRPHPLIEWSIETENWRKACLTTGRLDLNEAVLKFAVLGKSLERARNQKGFSRLKNRLKQLAEFDAAAFEAEVASSYIAKGWAVEFVEEGDQRSPDLKVTTGDGTLFWVECKRRDELTERDKNIHRFWIDLESGLLRVLGPNKLNFAILVKALVDPDRSTLADFTRFILQMIDKGGIGSINQETNEIRAAPDPTGKFNVLVHRLAAPDEEIKTSSIGLRASEDFDRVLIGAEAKKDEAAQTYFRNPVIVAFKNTQPSDKVTGIINAFKSAVGQLPEEGPSVVWIRIPDNAWVDKLDRSFNQAEGLIKSELTGNHNQRVNAVILMTRVFRKLQEADKTGLAYSPVTMTIVHQNPRCPVQTLSYNSPDKSQKSL
jgi:hypothetical protein